MNLDLTQLRLQSAPSRALDYMNQNMIDVGIREIIDPIRDLGLSRGTSQGFLDAFRLEKTGYLQMELVNDHQYADLLEYGWDDYDVFPKGKENGGADSLKIPTSGGFYFSKHTHPKGFKGYHLLQSADNWGFYERFLDRLIDGANSWLQEAAMK